MRPLCPECETPMEDHGIGAYEFWGQRCVDHDWVCPACEDAAVAPAAVAPEGEPE
jgi:hypothetical protein